MSVKARRLVISIFLLVIVLAFTGIVEGKADQSTNKFTIPKLMINVPCSAMQLSEGDAPTTFICTGLTEMVSGNFASITVPTPRIFEKIPDLTVVAIPTYVSIGWDENSFSHNDATRSVFNFSGGGSEQRLVNVRYELRIRPMEASAVPGGYASGNLLIDSPNRNYLKVTGIEGLGPHEAEYFTLCFDPIKSLVTVEPNQGGFGDCSGITSRIQSVPGLPASIGDRYQEPENYFSDEAIAFWSQFASTAGSADLEGSPAFELELSTLWNVEARVYWEKHEMKYIENEEIVDCRWEYWDDPDAEIDWSRWPGPIYCKTEIVEKVRWDEYCEPEQQNCAYAPTHPDDWWHSTAFISVTKALTPEGAYADSYSFVVIQAQPLLFLP